MLPVYNKLGSFLLASDNGQNWDVFTRIAPNALEPSVVVAPNGDLVAVMRTTHRSQYGETSVISRYVNKQWSAPQSLTEPLQHPANLLTLNNRQILLTYSDRDPYNQRILAKLSSDNGQTWSSAAQISQTFQNCDFGYPSTIEQSPGILLTVCYANPMRNPTFYFSNPDLYEHLQAAGYYYQYSLDELQRTIFSRDGQ